METRVCNKCLEEKAIHFFSHMKQKDGSYYIRISCRKCNNQSKRLKKLSEIEKQRMYQRQNEFVKSNPEYQVYLKLKHKNYRTCQKIRKWVNGDPKVSMTHGDFEFKERMERLFEPNMTWENYGRVWQIGMNIPALQLIREGRIDDVNKLENLIPIQKGSHIGRPKKMPGEYAMYKNQF